MADHLRLGPGHLLSSRRTPTGPPGGRSGVSRRDHGRDLASTLASVEPVESADDGDDQDVPVVLKFHAHTRLENGPLNGLRFEQLGEGRGWTYFVLSSRESREQFATLLREYAELPSDQPIDWEHPASWAKFVDDLDGIELYGAADRQDQSVADLTFRNGIDTVDCLLWPSSTASASDRVDAIAAVVEEARAGDERVRVVAVDRRPDRTMVRAVVTPRLLRELLGHVFVERVRGPLRTAVTQEAFFEATMPVQVPHAASAPVGVIDGVVSHANPLTAPYVQSAASFPIGHVFSGPDAHGTAVAGQAIWGDLDPLILGGTLNVPHPVVCARVIDIDGNRTQVAGIAHRTIEDAIRWAATEQGVRIINISINRDFPASTEALRDELTFTVDRLARELRLVIVVSAGNRLSTPVTGWHAGYPGYLTDDAAGIAAPGDGALVVTVGSHARRDVPERPAIRGDLPIAEAQEPSPFTRTGPARSATKRGTLKPEFSHHGGSWTWDSRGEMLDIHDPGTAAIVAIPPNVVPGRIVTPDSGTSYAAPSVAHEIARIAERYPQAGPNLLRALTALSARSTGREIDGTPGHRWRGYGVPEASRVLESGPQRVFLVLEDEMDTDRVAIHQLPIPPEYADQVRKRTFRVALAFDPPVRRNRREYIAGTMSVELVRGLSLDAVSQTYVRQPTRNQVEADSSLRRFDLPDKVFRPQLEPGSQTLESNTLIRRDYVNGNWDPDHQTYFLVVTHRQSPWTPKQRREYDTQTYALAVEIADETRNDLDLYAMMRARLEARARVRR